jgi:hypothetical protein
MIYSTLDIFLFGHYRHIFHPHKLSIILYFIYAARFCALHQHVSITFQLMPSSITITVIISFLLVQLFPNLVDVDLPFVASRNTLERISNRSHIIF